MLGWLKSALVLGVKVVGFLATGSSGKKVTVADALPFALTNLLPAVDSAIKYQQLDSKEKLDQWLVTIDASTGSDVMAVDIIKGLPADKEEEFFDHAVEIARIYGYHKIGVPGYVE